MMRKTILSDIREPGGNAIVDEDPVPVLAPGEVLVAVESSPVNPVDFLLAAGWYGGQPTVRQELGSEAVGTVVRASSGVDAAMVGRRVIMSACHARAQNSGTVIVSLHNIIAVAKKITGELAETDQPHVLTRHALRRATAFWLVAAMTTILLAASSAPSPLYPVFQAEFGFSAITLTAIFAAYVFALLMSLLTVGRLSDFVGRRPVLAVGLIVEAASMAIFWDAKGVAWLVVARIVQGFATGTAIGVLGAALLDLQPEAGSRLGSLVNSIAPTSGLALGAIATGVLVQYAPQPTRLVFAILAVIFVVLTIAVVALPEPVQRTPGAVASLRPQVAVPQQARRQFLRAIPTMVTTWALGGLILSVGGSLLGAVFGQTNHAVVGLILSLFAAAGAGSALLARNLLPASMTRIGTSFLAVGTGVFVVALASSALSAFVVALVIAGAGFGAAFLGALRSVISLAAPHERAALLSAVYVVSYLAFSLPALAAGLLITRDGLRNTALGYGVFVGVVIFGSMAFDAVSSRDRRDQSVAAAISIARRSGPDQLDGVEIVDAKR